MDIIIYTNNAGELAIVTPSPEWTGTLDELATKDILDAADTYLITTDADLPTDPTFRNAWKRGEQSAVVGVEMVEATEITHSMRRAARDVEFAPHDDIIAKNIPGDDLTAAEAARVIIRDRYAVIQTDIDACTLPTELKAIIDAESL